MPSLKAFVSHSSHDSEYVLQVCAYLKRHMQVFAYEDHQHEGSFVQKIFTELDGSQAVIAFISQHSEASAFVKHEIETAVVWKLSLIHI